ncbi:MAG TPA: hypothetical protein VGE97_09620 [Nitrososphaera sp.]
MKTFRKLVNETQAALVTMGPPRKKLNHAKPIKPAKVAMYMVLLKWLAEIYMIKNH